MLKAIVGHKERCYSLHAYNELVSFHVSHIPCKTLKCILDIKTATRVRLPIAVNHFQPFSVSGMDGQCQNG